MTKKKPLTPQERKWLAAATDPDKIRRALKVQYGISIVLLLLILASLLYACIDSDGFDRFGGFWIGLFTIQLLAQYFNIRMNRHLLKERARLDKANEANEPNKNE